MGFLDMLTRGLFGRGRGDDQEELQPGPMRTEELPGEKKEYGRLGGQHAVEDLRTRNRERRLGEEGPPGAEEEELPEEPELLGHRRGMELEAGRLERRAKWPKHIFGARTSRAFRRLRKALFRIESAEMPAERRSAERSFRFRMFRSPRGIKRRLDRYAGKELGELQGKYEHEIARLTRQGASARDLERAEKRFAGETRELRRNLNRRFYRPLRGIARRGGISSPGGIRPPF